MKNIKEFKTLDGSIGLYNVELNEIYHSKFGAKKEAFEKFTEPCLIINNRPLKILDICYGIGYNSKCALENFKQIELIDCVEIDSSLAKSSYKYEYDEKINKIIEDNIKKSDFIHFYFDDIRRVVKKLDKKYDIIFHDGFKPQLQPELWSEELILEISKLLDDNGIYCTYNHSKPVLNALLKTGLYLGKTVKDGKIAGTVASFNKNLIKKPFSEFELGELKTKSAITYKDKNLNQTSAQILLNRKIEVEKSDLITLSKYKKTGNNPEVLQ